MRLFHRSRKLLVYLCGLFAISLSQLAIAQQHAKPQWHADLNTGYEAFVISSEALQERARAYCQAPDNHQVTTIRDAWLSAFLDWQRIRFVDFGPIEQDNIAWQLQFWPDSKNLIARKTDQWLQGEQLIDAASIASDSVAAKGFPALEYVLFDPRVVNAGHALPAKRACDFLQTVSAQIHTNAMRLQAGWTSFELHFLSRPEYVHTTVLAAMHSLEILRDKRLAAPMGLGSTTRRNPYIADAWRSGESLATMHATLAGLQTYFLPGLVILLEERKLTPLAEQFRKQLSATLARLENMPAALTPLLESDDGYRQLQLLYIDVDRLTTLLNGSIASELGIIKGFNSSDGD
ncbi:imelysin family protein [Halopseudomonas salina]|uniref:Imelysin-like domain-containing protein n=1 Tax=Halopseudomonas salina TaxID=1323744 RepID=A0ABQ1PS96_9GAMM|nr:imelysin family protein [Halopseudomonas salina]GGD02699.1 hypothetical protein GCM10007418_22390 [Halopseudomonas salina]